MIVFGFVNPFCKPIRSSSWDNCVIALHFRIFILNVHMFVCITVRPVNLMFEEHALVSEVGTKPYNLTLMFLFLWVVYRIYLSIYICDRAYSIINTNEALVLQICICEQNIFQHIWMFHRKLNFDKNIYGYQVAPSTTTALLSINKPIAHNSDEYEVDPSQLSLSPWTQFRRIWSRPPLPPPPPEHNSHEYRDRNGCVVDPLLTHHPLEHNSGGKGVNPSTTMK